MARTITLALLVAALCLTPINASLIPGLPLLYSTPKFPAQESSNRLLTIHEASAFNQTFLHLLGGTWKTAKLGNATSSVCLELNIYSESTHLTSKTRREK